MIKYLMKTCGNTRIYQLIWGKFSAADGGRTYLFKGRGPYWAFKATIWLDSGMLSEAIIDVLSTISELLVRIQ